MVDVGKDVWIIEEKGNHGGMTEKTSRGEEGGREKP
jgi:hypothetical protein